MHQILRDGDLAPTFSEDTVLSRVVVAPALSAMNDRGDIVAVTEIAGPDVTPDDKVILWLRDRLRQLWYPLMRGEQEIAGRTVSMPSTTDMSSAYWNKTGGGDGHPQSMTDDATLAARLEFSDESHGIYLVHLAWPGDADGDGDLDLIDVALLQSCCLGPGVPVDPAECGPMDLDADNDVDFSDFLVFEGTMTGTW